MRGEQRVRGEQRARVEQQVRREQYGRGQQRESGHSGSFNQQQIFKASTTFFFTNFPPDHDSKEMWEIFSKWGKVVDVVIPSRVDKYGKIFGFVRFLNISNRKSFVVKLDRIWIGSFKIWMNIPKYRRQRFTDHTNKNSIIPSEPSGGSVGAAKHSLCDNRKFVDVVKSGRSPFFGIVANHVDPGTLKEKLFRDGFLTIHLTPLGGRSFLLRSEEDGDIEAFLEGEPEWFQSRFRVLRKWDNFFKLLASSLGTFLGLDHWTRSHHHLEYGRFLVAIPFLASVDKSCMVRIDNIDYVVKLVEEKVHCWHQCGKTSYSILTTNSSTSDSECSWLDRDPLGCPQDWAVEVEDDDVLASLERELDKAKTVGPTTLSSATNIGNGPLDFEFSNAINMEISVDPTTTIPSAPFSKEDPTLDFCKAHILSSGDLDKSLMSIPSLTDIINVEINEEINALGLLLPTPMCPSLKPLSHSSSIPQPKATTMYKTPQMIHNHQTRKHSPSPSLPSSNPPNQISKHRPVAHKKSVRFKPQCPESISKKYPKEFELWVDLRDLPPVPSSFKPQTCTILHDTNGGALGPIGSSSRCKQRTSLEPIRPTSRMETDMDVREFGRFIVVVDASDKKSDNLNIALLPPNKQAGTDSQKAVNGIDSHIRMDEPTIIP
ncbi:hypothetical protein Lal_00026511 [Lupinus albus]|nr:hypothetical protein Lal_00026511 [Lupinus albus]